MVDTSNICKRLVSWDYLAGAFCTGHWHYDRLENISFMIMSVSLKGCQMIDPIYSQRRLST